MASSARSSGRLASTTCHGGRLPDDETATAVLLQIGALGNIRTTTMKAFDAEQMRAIVQRTG